MNPDDKEIANILAALCNWFYGQKIPYRLGAVAMAKLVGTIIGSKAKDEEDLELGLDALHRVITVQAARIFLLEKEKSE